MNQAAALSTNENLYIEKTLLINPDIDIRIIEIISNKFAIEYDKIYYEASFSNDLAVDSLDIYEMIMAVEKEFSINIPDEDAEKLYTVGSLIKYVEKRLN